jgi:hypothetical protein
MHLVIFLAIGLIATTMPVRSQGLTKSGCDEVVMTITELSRAAAGMLIHVENMNLAPLRAGGDKVVVPVQHLEEARKNLIPALSEFALAAKDLGQVVPAMCPQ